MTLKEDTPYPGGVSDCLAPRASSASEAPPGVAWAPPPPRLRMLGGRSGLWTIGPHLPSSSSQHSDAQSGFPGPLLAPRKYSPLFRHLEHGFCFVLFVGFFGASLHSFSLTPTSKPSKDPIGSFFKMHPGESLLWLSDNELN